MLQIQTVITESLSPAISISGIGLLVVAVTNRLQTIGTRIRDLNAEIRQEQDAALLANAQLQVRYFMKRADIMQYSLFQLYAALSFMVFTALSIALVHVHVFSSTLRIPMFTFLLGLGFMFISCCLEATEIVWNIRCLKLDAEVTQNLVNKSHFKSQNN